MIRYYLLRATKKIFGNKLFFVYRTSKGIKNFNLGFLSVLFNPNIYKELLIDSKDLYLGPDYLKDEYSLINLSINDSPHYKLMETLFNNEDVLETDYMFRKRNGTLDWRDITPISSSYINSIKNKFKQRLIDIETDCYDPIIVYEYKEKYYIFDGKHRAALCSYLKKPIKSLVVSNDCIRSYTNRIFFEMMKDDNFYSKHNAFIKNEG